MIAMDDLAPFDPTEPIAILTPPKYEPRKRSLPVIKPDSTIEVSESQWKRQHLDLSFMVQKRPPLPLIDYQTTPTNTVMNVLFG